jgi:hypothetical protein
MEDVYSLIPISISELAISSLLCVLMVVLYIQSHILYILCMKGLDGVSLPDLYCREWGIHKKLGTPPYSFILFHWPRKITLEMLKMTYNELAYDLIFAGFVVVAIVSIITC